MLRLILLSALLVVLAGCDTRDERPLTLAERVAGAWQLMEVRDGDIDVTGPFRQAVGTIQLELQSVGCCSDRAAYRLTVTQPDGKVVVTQNSYLANDSPLDRGDFILLEGEGMPLALTLLYAFDTNFREMTLTASGNVIGVNEDLALLGIDYRFREQLVWVLDRLD